MAKKTSNKKNIVRYRKNGFHINISVVIFAFVLLYFLISIISYLTHKHISVYEVQKGQIAKNSYYTGLIIRDEEVTKADITGSINYYMKEGDKAGYNDLICSIDKNGSISKEITAAGTDGTTMSKEEMAEIMSLVSDYTGTQTDMQFYNVYSFKDNINANVQENLYLAALEALADKTSAAIDKNTFSFERTKSDGVIAFYTDGYEDLTVSNFKPDKYAPGNYTKTNLKSNHSVQNGQALYKTINSEDWYLMVPINEEDTKMYKELIAEGSETFIIHVTFLKDGTSCYSTAKICEYPDGNFMQLSFNSSMVRFISSRYLEVELGGADDGGLKIPNTAIVEKEFIKIPSTYISYGDNSADPGVIKVSQDKKGKTSVEFIETDLYYQDEDGFYYVDEDALNYGDTIQKPESTDTMTLTDAGKLQGVYNVNKGYAVYKIINKISENEEYTIIKTGTSYGITLYDRIALDGASIKEGELVH